MKTIKLYNMLLAGENEEGLFRDFAQKVISNFPEIIVRIVLAVLLFSVGKLIIRKILKILNKASLKKNPDENNISAIGIIISICLHVVLAFIILAILGIPVSSVLYVFLALVISVIIALKDYINILACGVVIVITRPFRIGEQVEIAGGIKGTVKDISLLRTIIITSDNGMNIIPNNKVTSNNIINYSRQGIRLATVKAGISYEQNIYPAKELILKIMQESPYFTEKSDPEVIVSELLKNHVELEGRMMVKSEQYDEYKRYIVEQVKVKFDEAGIKLDFN